VPRHSTILEIDERLMAAVRALAAGDGRSEDEVVEESLRRYFGLRGIAVLDTLAEQQAESGEDLDDEAAMAVVVEELRAVRAQRAGHEAMSVPSIRGRKRILGDRSTTQWTGASRRTTPLR